MAEELLGDIELHRVSALDMARKASRLARLIDDVDAMGWLTYEVAGYPKPLDDRATAAALRSNRRAPENKVWTTGLGGLETNIESVAAQIAGLAGPIPSGDWAYRVSQDRATERARLTQFLREQREVLDRVLGGIHVYVAERYQELRFGSAVETAFEVVRSEVDGAIADLVPDALPMLSAAFENATSGHPEHWANAAATCRRLIKLVADALRPPGAPKEIHGGRTVQMGDGNYINRLVDWIEASAVSETAAAVIAADLEYLGRRLDASDEAGHKGAHDAVNRYDASRFITGTYLLLGDVLRLRDAQRAKD